jgi:hypothetical protein
MKKSTFKALEPPEWALPIQPFLTDGTGYKEQLHLLTKLRELGPKDARPICVGRNPPLCHWVDFYRDGSGWVPVSSLRWATPKEKAKFKDMKPVDPMARKK